MTSLAGKLEIGRRRLASSGLVDGPFKRPADVVRWHGAMQAQDYGPTKWSIALRAPGATDAGLDRALRAGSIVRTHVLRPTWHLVARADARWLLELTGPLVQKQNEPRYRDLGLDARTRRRAEGVISDALSGGNRLTRSEIGSVLDAKRIDRSGQRLPYILMHCELTAAICSGGLSGKQQTYALFDERVPESPRKDRDEAIVELARRYLAGHGPATARDLRWWSSLPMADVKGALQSLGNEVESETMDGLTFWSLAADGPPSRPRRRAYLLHIYDEVIVGYTESRFHGDPRGPAARRAQRERAVPTGVVFLDGAIAGRWRRAVQRDVVTVEIVTYGDLKTSEVRAVETAVGELGRFLDRPVTLERG